MDQQQLPEAGINSISSISRSNACHVYMGIWVYAYMRICVCMLPAVGLSSRYQQLSSTFLSAATSNAYTYAMIT
jgi:hypothetical protein